MKLLFDENLSRKLVPLLADLYPGSDHVIRLGLERTDDGRIWTFARVNEYTIVTQDADFAERSSSEGAPPKIVWVRTGNSTTGEVERLLRTNYGTLQMFETDPSDSCLILER